MSLGRVTRGLGPDAKFAEWVRVARRIYDEQVTQGWRHRVFREFRAVFLANDRLSADGGFIFNWAAENYVDAALMSLRREMDVQDGTENLRNLLEDIIEAPDVITRARHLAMWAPNTDFDREHASRVFDRFGVVRVADHPERDHIDPAGVQADLRALEQAVGQVRIYAERTRAHRTPQQNVDTTSVTFRAMHAAIEEIRKVVGKYYALLTLGSVVEWEPVPQYDTFAAYQQVWAPDPRRLGAALEQEERELAEPPTEDDAT